MQVSEDYSRVWEQTDQQAESGGSDSEYGLESTARTAGTTAQVDPTDAADGPLTRHLGSAAWDTQELLLAVSLVNTLLLLYWVMTEVDQ